MSLTTDRQDERLDIIEPSGMQKAYLVLSDEELAKGFVRPVRRSYVHILCGHVTTMADKLAETYARDPHFYGGTFCSFCGKHFDLFKYEGETRLSNFKWEGTDEAVGS
jgi:hypothetical protein